ncbi:MAG: FeoB-associated Cys-rich membrane protein [Clostridia bacterium]|nr:FeoB-associated Cys-rich membrane protein [Clostridia bacterium]
MIDLIVILILAVIAGAAGLYIYRAKKRGQTCIGCPHAGACAKTSSGGCGGNCAGCSGGCASKKSDDGKKPS